MDSNIRKLITKYKKALIVVVAFDALLISLGVYFVFSETYRSDPWASGFTPLIQSNDIYIEVTLILLVYAPISALIGGLVGGYFLAPVFLFIHKNGPLGPKLLYGIQDRPRPQTFTKMGRGYYPALLALNVNSIILFSAPWILGLILNQEFIELAGSYTMNYVPGFLVLLMFTVGLGTLVFSPTWFLTDAGVVYSNKVKAAGTDKPVEGRAVGGRFTDFLRGYAGLGVVFSYIQFLSVYISEQVIPPNPIDVIVFAIFFFGLPIFLLISIIPSLLILDLIKEHRIRFVRNFATKIGIRDFVEILFEKVDRPR